MLNSCTNLISRVSPFFLQHSYYNTPFSQAKVLDHTIANAIIIISTQDKAKEIVKVITKAAN
jgi:hypothetical protein